jgi:hypothetical protein
MMKKLTVFAILITGVLSLQVQAAKAGLLQDLEKKQTADQNITTTATLKSSSRLFRSKDDLTSVIMVIPSGSTVNVLDSDSVYLHVVFEENEGFVLKRHAVIDKTEANTPQAIAQQPADAQVQPGQRQVMSRLSYLENKYGSNLASKIAAGKIWKGMNAEMVTDSWGIPEKINKVTNENIRKEEWIFINTWLHFENNTLIEWGPLNK